MALGQNPSLSQHPIQGQQVVGKTLAKLLKREAAKGFMVVTNRGTQSRAQHRDCGFGARGR